MKPRNKFAGLTAVLQVVLLLSLTLPVRLATEVRAQDRALPFLTAATDTHAYVLLLDAPPGMQGFNVYRKGQDDAEPSLLTLAPVVAVADPARARTLLGDDFAWIARALRVQDAFEVLSRLRTDPGASMAISLASLRAAAVAGRLFVDDTVERGRTYEYRIEILDLDGEVLASGSREFEVRDRHPESVPSGVTADAGDGNIRVAWEFPDYAGDPEDVVVGFHVYRSEAGGSFERLQQNPILRQDDLSFRVDASVHNTRPYSYYATAVDFIGRESEPSAIVSGTPEDLTPPSIPSQVEVFSEANALLVTWRLNLELDVSHYDVYRSLELEAGYEKINSEPIPVDQASYRDDDVHSGPVYHYVVTAVDLAGNESEFSNATTGRPLDTKGPGAPDGLTVMLQGHEVTLSWIAPTDADLEGFYVYRKRDEQDFLPITQRPLPKDSIRVVDAGYDNRGLRPGKAYTYAVAALDHALNESPYAVVEVAIPDDEPPTPPVESYARSTAEGLVDLQWQPSLALDVVGYRVYRSESEADVAAVIEVDGSTFETTDSTVSRGRTYAYYVVAVDAVGNESSGTEPTSVTPRDLSAPPPPMRVQATAVAEGVAVSWEHVRVPDLVGYMVYRSDSPYGVAEQLTSSPLVETHFRDPQGMSGQYYRVTSLDTSGHENKGGEAVEARSETSSF
ncbi:MAG: hypothetical protein HKN37_00250 [Rhodothermales bacterium]|nr:hypothetical protein [Rhodothermales bacterium]